MSKDDILSFVEISEDVFDKIMKEINHESDQIKMIDDESWAIDEVSNIDNQLISFSVYIKQGKYDKLQTIMEDIAKRYELEDRDLVIVGETATKLREALLEYRRSQKDKRMKVLRSSTLFMLWLEEVLKNGGDKQGATEKN